jgi:hypothetical protein
MRTYFDDKIRLRSQRLADLKQQTAELERRLSDARGSLERELAEFSDSGDVAPDQLREARRHTLGDFGRGYDADRMSDIYAAPRPSAGYDGPHSCGKAHLSDDRTDIIMSRGRRNAYHPLLARARKMATGAAVLAALVGFAVIMFFRGGAEWPASVTKVQTQAATACRNPDVKSEPGQVNFACAEATRQILWVFALITSGNNPNFVDPKTGRRGLEPITPAQGGEVAWSLNLHHPYNPSNPIDSLAVAARAINNIVGGATLTGASGKPVVQPGLESRPANCVRYTGSAALTSRANFPSICARPVTSPAGLTALVTDIYHKWIVGAPARAAEEAAVLFANAKDPGNPQVQAILKHLPNPQLLG